VKILLLFVAVATFVFSVGGSDADAQAGGATGQSTNWPTYGSNLASHRYSPADQITKDRSAC
jgi:glucose dehydrogenase